MNATLTLIFAIVLLMGPLVIVAYARWRRRRLGSPAFPPAWTKVLEQYLPVHKKLPAPLKQQHQQLIQLFIRQKEFIGCAGILITDEMKVIIAAQACLLLLNRPTNEYSSLKTIYIYPTTFRKTHEIRNTIGLVSTVSQDLLGESWSNGKIVLAWDDVEKGIRNFTDGHNVVLHEFAHQLDQESGSANGAPLLYTKAAYKSWAYVMGCEFEKLQQRNKRKPSIIDHYGATNPAEFFAVATETFFEEPNKMFKHHRALFEELKNYYHLDPRQWTNGNQPPNPNRS